MDDTRAALDALVAQHPSSSPGRHGTREPWNRLLRRNRIDYSLRILGLSMAGVGPSMAGVRGLKNPIYLWARILRAVPVPGFGPPTRCAEYVLQQDDTSDVAIGGDVLTSCSRPSSFLNLLVFPRAPTTSISKVAGLGLGDRTTCSTGSLGLYSVQHGKS